MDTTQKQFRTVLGIQCSNMAHLTFQKSAAKHENSNLIFVPCLKQNSFVLLLKIGRE